MKTIWKYILVATVISTVGDLSAQTIIFNETFDPLSSGKAVQDGYTFGDTTASSSGVVSGVGVGGTAAWETVNTAASGANGFSGVGAQYQDPNTGGLNSSPNLGDYTLSFDAMATETAGNTPSLTINIQTWSGTSFGGTQTGSLTAGSNGVGTQPLFSSYTHYSLNLGDNSTFQTIQGGFTPAGGTIQVTMQLNGGGTTPYTDTLDIDNLELTMAVPEPSSLALCAMSALMGVFSLRRKK